MLYALLGMLDPEVGDQMLLQNFQNFVNYVPIDAA